MSTRSGAAYAAPMTSVPWFRTTGDAAEAMPVDGVLGETTDEAMDAALAEHDAREAEIAREQYRTSGLPDITPDAAVMPQLARGETVVAIRASATVDRHDAAGQAEAVSGPLYVTNRRLLHLGEPPVAVELSLVDELALVGERLLVSLRDGSAVGFEVPGPRLLRVQIAAALMGSRL
jgi:hypothetical protein